MKGSLDWKARCFKHRAFSLIELAVTAGIISILTVLLFIGYPIVRDRAETTRCMSNLRQLHLTLTAAIEDRGHWPQEPEALWSAEDSAGSEDWWIKELEPYGATEKLWQCPTIMRTVTTKSSDGRPRAHYAPTPFDDLPNTPYKWPEMPWLAEIYNAHGHGALICLPNGTVKPWTQTGPQ